MSINSRVTIHFLFQRRRRISRKGAKGAKITRKIKLRYAPSESWKRRVLKHAFVVEAKKAIVSNHDVIEDAHAHHITDFF
jgi:hypothetical protein